MSQTITTIANEAVNRKITVPLTVKLRLNQTYAPKLTRSFQNMTSQFQRLRNTFAAIFVILIHATAPCASQRKSMTTQSETIVLLHGIGKSRFDMIAMERYLKTHGYNVLNWAYPSTRYGLETLADQLHEKLAEDPAKTYSFVTHSMGGIVVRTYLSKYQPHNVSRFVMIAPPNQGAFLADLLCKLLPYKFWMGPAGQQLRQGQEGCCSSAGIPPCEFGIIAGGTGRKIGMNPLVPGDNDVIVSVEATRLPGAKDFTVLPYPHAVIQMMPQTCRYVNEFLRTGSFGEVQNKKRRALPVENAAP